MTPHLMAGGRCWLRTLLMELYREARRLTESLDRGPDFLARLETAENQAAQLRLELEQFAASPAPDRRPPRRRVSETGAMMHPRHSPPTTTPESSAP